MLRNLLILPDGTELSSGTGTASAIQSSTLTQSVNADKELTIGSVCASMLEAKILTPGGSLSVTAGDKVTLYKVDDAGNRHTIGVFTLENPTRTTANTMKITGYDNMTKLDKDLTGWLSSLAGWPYNILDFASEVCKECKLEFVPGDVQNRDFQVRKFSSSGVTGRQLMKWIGEVTCSFCRADADGNIRLDWYKPLTTHAIGYKSGLNDEVIYDMYEGDLAFVTSDVSSDITGENVHLDSARFTVTDDGNGNVVISMDGCVETIYYFQNGLDYEEYTVQPVDAVQIQLGDSEAGYRWPAAEETANIYVISGNPLLSSASDEMRAVLDNILSRLSTVTYTPCKVSVASTMNIAAGNTISITDKNGKTITIYVMTATTSGQKLTLEGTGSHRRDSTSAQNNPSAQQVAQNAAQNAVDGQTQEDIFNKLTKNKKLKGIYMENGELYINADYLRSGTLDADQIQVINLVAEKVKSVAGNAELNVDGAELRFLVDGNRTIWMSSSTMPIMYMTDYEGGAPVSHCELTPHHLKVGGTSVQPIFEISTQGGSTKLNLASTGYKTLFWKDNGDGTFTLMGK